MSAADLLGEHPKQIKAALRRALLELRAAETAEAMDAAGGEQTDDGRDVISAPYTAGAGKALDAPDTAGAAEAGNLPSAQNAHTSTRADAQICARLAVLPAYQSARTVFCFVGSAQEIDTSVFLQTVINDGKILCVPFCAPSQKGVMYAKRVSDLRQLAKGAFGLAAPPVSAQTVPPQEIDFAVLPCLTADATGLRLGYGGGYYDRYLPQLGAGCTCIAVCRKRWVTAAGIIPEEPHDVRASGVLTEEGFL